MCYSLYEYFVIKKVVVVMKENKIIELKKDILNGKAEFLDIICEIMDKNKILYSDNYGDLSKEEIKEVM